MTPYCHTIVQFQFLPLISKPLEKVVYTRIYDIITNHKILSPNQFGFRKNHYTYMAINN